MALLTLAQALNDALRTAMRADPRVLVLGEDVGQAGGVFRVTEGLWQEFGAARALDTPLAESAIVGTAIGMAVGGLRPVAEIQFMGFLYPALDQLAAQAARLRTRSAGRLSVPLVVRCPYGGGVRSPELHSDALEALCVHSAGLKVVAPSSPYDAKGLLLAAIADPDPVVFLEPLRLYRAGRQEVPEGDYRIPLGRCRIARPGRDLTLVAWGSTVPTALEAAQQAAQQGVEAEVVDLRTLSPLDEEGLLASVRRTHRLVVVQEAPRSAGLAAEVAALAAEEAMLDLAAPVLRVTGYDTPYPVPLGEDRYRPSAARVLSAIRRVMAF